jgi:hypothetical protein
MTLIFTCGDCKNHSWPSRLVIFSVPTRENNVFYTFFIDKLDISKKPHQLLFYIMETFDKNVNKDPLTFLPASFVGDLVLRIDVSQIKAF